MNYIKNLLGMTQKTQPQYKWKHEELTVRGSSKAHPISLDGLLKSGAIDALIPIDRDSFILQTQTEDWYFVKTDPDLVLALPSVTGSACTEVVSCICDSSTLFTLTVLFLEGSCTEFCIYAFHFGSWSWERLAAVPCELPRLWCAPEDLPMLGGRSQACLWTETPGSLDVNLHLKTEHRSHYVVSISVGFFSHSKVTRIQVDKIAHSATLIHADRHTFTFELDGTRIGQFGRPNGELLTPSTDQRAGHSELSTWPIKGTPLGSPQEGAWCPSRWSKRVASVPVVILPDGPSASPQVWVLHFGIRSLTRWEYVGTLHKMCHTGVAMSDGGYVVALQSGCFYPGRISRFRRTQLDHFSNDCSGQFVSF